jgi:hypothetical protein
MAAARRRRAQGNPSQIDARDLARRQQEHQLLFLRQGRGKAQITVQQEKLGSQVAALEQKKVWAKSLRDLAQLAAAD